MLLGSSEEFVSRNYIAQRLHFKQKQGRKKERDAETRIHEYNSQRRDPEIS